MNKENTRNTTIIVGTKKKTKYYSWNVGKYLTMTYVVWKVRARSLAG